MVAEKWGQRYIGVVSYSGYSNVVKPPLLTYELRSGDATLTQDV